LDLVEPLGLSNSSVFVKERQWSLPQRAL
jgi:hypothetical protein